MNGIESHPNDQRALCPAFRVRVGVRRGGVGMAGPDQSMPELEEPLRGPCPRNSLVQRTALLGTLGNPEDA